MPAKHSLADGPVAGDGWWCVPEAVDGYGGLRRPADGRVFAARRRRLDRLCREAIDTLCQWMDRCDRPYVSVSGGKDSLITLILAREVDTDVEAVHFASRERALPSVQAMLDWVRDTYSLTVLVWGSDLEARERYRMEATSSRFGRIVAEMTEARGFDGQACGYRADEAVGRWIHRNVHGELYQWTDGRWACSPLLDWTYDDVWAFIVRHRLPYPELYDLEDGQQREQRRVDHAFGADAANRGRIARLKKFYPDYYRQLVEAVPEAREYV